MPKSTFFSLIFHFLLILLIASTYLISKKKPNNADGLLLNKTVHATLYSADKLAGLQETLAPQQEEESLETSQPESTEEKAIKELILTQKIAPKKELQDPPKKPAKPKKLVHNQNKGPKNKSTQNMDNKDLKTQLTQSSATQTGINHSAKPLQRSTPNYPRRALDRNIEGYVVVQFDIDTNGNTQNIKIIESNPSNIFDKSTIQTIKKWRYEKIATQNIEIKIEFKRSGLIQIT